MNSLAQHPEAGVEGTWALGARNLLELPYEGYAFGADIELSRRDRWPTGTAQAGNRGEPHAWFVCYGPFDNPEIVITVMIENGGHGGEVAVPLAQKFLDVFLDNVSFEDLV